VWAREEGYRTAKARCANGYVDRPSLASEETRLVEDAPRVAANEISRVGPSRLFAADPLGYVTGETAVLCPAEGGVMSLLEQARTGLREMPSNAGWLVSRARARRPKISAAVVDAAPGSGGSVDVRLERAREAAERAWEAEERAVDAGREAHESSDYAQQVSKRGHARLARLDRETRQWIKQRLAEARQAADEWVEQRLAEAEKAANESVERERQAAEKEAQQERREVSAEVEQEIEEAQLEAEESHERAEYLAGEATAHMAEAARLAEEAAEAAEEAQRQSKQLADEAQQQASDARAREEELSEQPTAAAKDTARRLEGDSDGGLESYNKPQLVELAASIGVEGRTTMTKHELVEAIANASRTKH